MRYIRKIWAVRATERIANLALGLPKVRYSRQIRIKIISFIAASIGEVRNCRQIKGAMGGAKIARSHINR